MTAFGQFKLTSEQQNWVEQTLSRMTLEERVGQVLFAVSPAAFMNLQGGEFQKISANIQSYHVGGYHIEGGDPATAYLLISRNILVLSPLIAAQIADDPFVGRTGRKCRMVPHPPTVRRPEGRAVTETVRALERAGLTFRDYFVSDSLCCPARASIFTGNLPHDTHVFGNFGSDGGFKTFSGSIMPIQGDFTASKITLDGSLSPELIDSNPL